MRRSPNPWPIGLREPNPAGVRETRAVAVMVGHSEEVGSGYANAGGERYLVISVAVRNGQGGITAKWREATVRQTTYRAQSPGSAAGATSTVGALTRVGWIVSGCAVIRPGSD